MLEVHTPGNVYIASFLIQVHGKVTQSVILQTTSTAIYFSYTTERNVTQPVICKGRGKITVPALNI